MSKIDLSASSFYGAIDELLLPATLCDNSNGSSNEKENKYLCRRAKLDDLNSIHEFLTKVDQYQGRDQDQDSEQLSSVMPLEVLQKDYSEATTTSSSDGSEGIGRIGEPIPFYIVVEEGKDIKGVALWTFGYSTWKGRVMNLDTFATIGIENVNGKDKDAPTLIRNELMTCLIRIAKLLDCTRIVYQARGEHAEFFQKDFNADLLGEWLTLQMEREQMESFVSTRDHWARELRSRYSSSATKNRLDPLLAKDTGDKMQFKSLNNREDNVQAVMDGILLQMNAIVQCCKLGKKAASESDQKSGTTSPRIQLRRATTSDANSILQLVHGLASYEKASHEVSVNPSIYIRDDPLFQCILVEVLTEDAEKLDFHDDDASHKGTLEVVGMGFFYLGNSTSSGKYLYLEDLFVEHEYRGYGCGKAIMYSLAEISMQLGCHRFVWQALDWNTPALNFYSSIGAKVCDGLRTIRLDQERIHS